jgi:uncharacterized protein (DUF1800 family)
MKARYRLPTSLLLLIAGPLGAALFADEPKSAFPESVGSESVSETAAPVSPISMDNVPADSPLRAMLAPQSTAAVTAGLTVTLAANSTPPQTYGTAITWTATATGGTTPYTYLFARMDHGTWAVVQPYSASNTYTWTPAAADAGSHMVGVWVRNAGSTNPYDAAQYTAAFTIFAPPTISALAANLTLPRPVGTKITFTATATGVPGPLEYRFFRLDGSTWNLVQDYSASKAYAWTTTGADMGQHVVAVWVRNVGSTEPYQAWRTTPYFNINGSASVSALTTPSTFPMPAGTPITFTATASGNPGPLQYRFWKWDGTSWTMIQDYSSNNSVTWAPVAAGTYGISVWVRSVGSPAAFDAGKTTPFFSLQAPGPLAAAGLLVAPPLPKPQGSIIMWVPITTGGIAPLTYKFYRYSFQTGLWTIAQDWSANGSFVWTPTAADVGDYAMSIWVRNAGSNTNYDVRFDTGKFSITPPTTDIVRFLEQATFGPTDAETERVRTMGMSAWIDDQFNTPPTGYPPFTPVADNPPTNCTGNCQRDNYSMYPMQRLFFTNALYGADQLRQRVAFALHSLVVTSGFDLPNPSWSQPYHDAIWRNTFGNYRQLLGDITLNAAMGDYLNMDTSTKNNPNENYAREVMQLFSVGTDTLNIDGTPQTLADGTIIPVYDQFTVTEFARAFSGWRLANPIAPGITNYRDPMVAVLANHDLGSKTLLNGFVTGAGASPLQDLNDALDNIFNHPNVGPYISRHLIRQLVTSNPSPAYIQRIATIFNDNGSGVRGDLKAVVKAILLDPEARQITPSDPNFGHLKDPVLVMNQFLRATNAMSANRQALSDGYLSPQSSSLGQDILRPPTVFSYYPADYVLPGTTVGAPEFGIFQSVTALKRPNFMNTMIFSNIPTSANAPNGTSIDLSYWQILAVYPPALVKELDRRFLHDTMSPQMQTSILGAINAISPSNPILRAQTGLYLVATSSQYQVER